MSDEIGMPPPAPSWPAGWYPSHTAPGRQEYWDGARWTGALQPVAATAPPPPVSTAAAAAATATPTAATRKLGISTWVGAAAVGLVLIVALTTNGPSGFLVWAGVVALGTAIYVVVTGRRSWLRVPSRKAGAILVAAAVVATFVGAGIAPRSSESSTSSFVDSNQSLGDDTSEADTPIESATATAKPTTRKPAVTTKNEVTVEDVPFTESVVDDGNLAAGTQAVVTAGAPGKRTITYKVTYTDGVETGRTVASDKVTVAPVTQVIANGTYVAPPPPPPPAAPSGCNGNYEGACVPIASDVDCAGGSGNGPAYVQGPVYVVGSDVYDLDRDGDGIACD